ncbi:MAG: DUF1552 domain-containing protein [Myxococcales bacterium]|nr:DUF1552 domain-containing protein [Myxococcales bacterium]
MIRVGRRSFLRGVIGGTVITVGLPFLEWTHKWIPRGHAATTSDGFPVRFGLFFWGNGILPERFVPQQTGDSWELSEQLQPLRSFQQKLTVVSGMQVAVPNVEPHFATAAGILSGRPLQSTGANATFAGPSIDQVIASVLGEDTLYRSLEFGAASNKGLSHNGPNSINYPETSPFALFDRVFGKSFKLPGTESVTDPTLALRQSVLDAVTADIKKLQTKVSSNDKVRLEQHLDGIRALEKKLAKLAADPPNLAACAYPTQPEPDYPDIDGRPQLQEKNAAMAEIIAFAMACDQTRVFSNFITEPVNNLLFKNAPAGHHQLTHDEPGEQPEVHAITVQCIEAFAAQLAALDAIVEGEQTLLDHCMILGTSDVSFAKLHSGDDFPILLAGGAGKLKMGVHYRSPSKENASKVLLTLARAAGLDMTSFGDAEGFVNQSLSAIEV